MTKDIFPPNLSTETKQKLTSLAESVYNKPIKELTKDKVILIIQMDMATVINKMAISASATRPTNIKYATNNYFTSMEIDLSGISKIYSNILEGLEQDKIIDTYLELKSTLYGLIKLKYESTENYLRSLLDIAITRDGCPTVGRGNDE